MTMSDNEPVPVEVIGKHPHAGRRGTIPCQNGRMEAISVLGATMFKVEFEPDGRYPEACFAERPNLRLLGKPARAR